ncbi:MAG: glucose-6-phosphate dehydrogenase assembly protein OpcA [Galactobacter sp.]
MIVDLTNTLTSEVAKALVQLRRDGGVGGTARVLTLLVPTTPEAEEHAIETAQSAAVEHPCRIIVMVIGDPTAQTRMDARVLGGADVGPSEIVVLRLHGELCRLNESLVSALLLPDDPVFTWWAGDFTPNPSETELGSVSQRRITDASRAKDPFRALEQLSASWRPGDTDLSWTRLTLWRTQLTSIVDQFGVTGLKDITVRGHVGSPSTALLAAWLQWALPEVSVHLAEAESAAPVGGVRLSREGGDIELHRPHGDVADLHLPGQPVQLVALPVRTDPLCLAEELRQLDDDVVLGAVLRDGLPRCDLSPVAPSPR